MANSEKEVIKNMLNYIMNAKDIPSRELIKDGRLDLLVEWYLFQSEAIRTNPGIQDLPNEITYYVQKINQLTGTNFKNELMIKNSDSLYYLTDGDDVVVVMDPKRSELDVSTLYLSLDDQDILLFKTEDEAKIFVDKHMPPLTEIFTDKASAILNSDCSLLKYFGDCYISAENSSLSTLTSAQWCNLFDINK